MILSLWITYDSAGTLHSRGLEMVNVWFSKPDFLYLKNTRDWEDENLPFGDENGQRAGVQRRVGWCGSLYDHRVVTESISFGKLFGYGEGLPQFVWNKLIEHFGDPELRHWSDIEKAGKALPENFLLNIEAEINFKGL